MKVLNNGGEDEYENIKNKWRKKKGIFRKCEGKDGDGRI